jgi:hypothetical protein
MDRITGSSFPPETIRVVICCQNLRILSTSKTCDMPNRLAIIMSELGQRRSQCMLEDKGVSFSCTDFLQLINAACLRQVLSKNCNCTEFHRYSGATLLKLPSTSKKLSAKIPQCTISPANDNTVITTYVFPQTLP